MQSSYVLYQCQRSYPWSIVYSSLYTTRIQKSLFILLPLVHLVGLNLRFFLRHAEEFRCIYNRKFIRLPLHAWLSFSTYAHTCRHQVITRFFSTPREVNPLVLRQFFYWPNEICHPDLPPTTIIPKLIVLASSISYPHKETILNSFIILSEGNSISSSSSSARTLWIHSTSELYHHHGANTKQNTKMPSTMPCRAWVW